MLTLEGSGRLRLFILPDIRENMYLVPAPFFHLPQVCYIFKRSFSRRIKYSLTLEIAVYLHSVLLKLNHNLESKVSSIYFFYVSSGQYSIQEKPKIPNWFCNNIRHARLAQKHHKILKTRAHLKINQYN